MSVPTPEVDLDTGYEAPARARRPFPTLLVLVAVAALLVSAGVRAAVDRTPELPPPPSVSATAGLRTVVLDPDPVAMLDVTVRNQGRDVLAVDAVTTGPAGGSAARTAVSRSVPPGADAVLAVRLPIRCPDGATGEPPPAVRVEARLVAGADGRQDGTAAGTQPRVVEAVPLGEFARFGGTCSSADARLPQGWRSTLPATLVRADERGLRLRVRGLPSAEQLALLYVDPEGWLTTGNTQVVARSGGELTVDVGPLEFTCDDPPEGPLPTFAVMYFHEPPSGPPRPSLVSVGTGLTNWVLQQWDRTCPAAGAPGGG